jgi:signal transduction histidine kinase
MDPFEISCPCCKAVSHYQKNLASVALRSEEEAMQALSAPRDERLLSCKNPTCPAPFEAVICSGIELARSVRNSVVDAWSIPRCFQLRKARGGEKYPNRFVVLLNRKPVERCPTVNLSELVDTRLLSKAMLGFAVRVGAPLTIFEAWTVGKSQFWLPIENPVQVTNLVPLEFTAVCAECRQVSLEFVDAEFKKHRSGPQCGHYEYCPSRLCESDGKGRGPERDRCLAYLELRTRHSLCHNSDLSLIEKLAGRFERNHPAWDKRYEPLVQECWAGFNEIAFPILVHNHLIGVAMTGQFLPEGVQPPSFNELCAAETRWRTERQMDQRPLICAAKARMKKVLFKPNVLSLRERGNTPDKHALLRPTEEEISELKSSMGEDTRQLAEIAQDRYLQQRERRESAFRDELCGILLRNFLDGSDFRDFLKDVLSRMSEFWAFRRICLLMGSDFEDDLRLYATHNVTPDKTYETYLGDTKPYVDLSHPLTNETGAGGVTLLPGHEYSDNSETRRWRAFAANLDISGCHPVLDLRKGAFLVWLHTGTRYYVFCFNDRDMDRVSPAVRDSGPVRTTISDECKQQVLTTCLRVAERLHNFWLSYDQLQDNRALSHSLAHPLTRMFAPTGSLGARLFRYRESIQRRHPDFYDIAQRFHELVRTCTWLFKDQLERLANAARVEESLKNAADGQTDIMKILDEAKPQYQTVALYRRRKWVYEGTSLAQVFVEGNHDLIRLAVRNVLDNAFKYSPNVANVLVSLKRESQEWVLEVSNTGPLVLPEELKRLTIRGFRGRYAKKRTHSGAAEGSGLGLYLVDRIMKAIGGRFTTACDPVESLRDKPLGAFVSELRFRVAARRKT